MCAECLVGVVVARAHPDVGLEATESRCCELVLGRAPMVGDVTGDCDEVMIGVVPEMVEDVLERNGRVVRAASLRLEPGLEEVCVGQLDDADRSVDARMVVR
jgi:hypothetical protein